MRRLARVLNAIAALAASTPPAAAQESWATSRAASVQGPYPVGNPSAQPDQRFAFPVPAAGARDPSFRLIVRPILWGREARLRFSNAFGTRPLRLDPNRTGYHAMGGSIDLKLVVPGLAR